MSRSLCALAVTTTAFVSSTQAATFLTFADPSQGSSTPLFTLSAGLLTGGWSGMNLTLETPGISQPDYANATFEFDPVMATQVGGTAFFTLGAGQIRFFEAGGVTLIARINFTGGQLSPSGFGSSEFAGFGVTFSGPVIDPFIPFNEAFAFSFANQVGTPTNYTATAAFTSSGNNIPAPASIALMGLGLLVVARRRR